MAGKQLQTVLHVFRRYILQRNWSIFKEREIQNGVQLLVTDGATRISINCYTNGNAFIQGDVGALKTDVQSWWQQQKASSASPRLAGADLSASMRAIVDAFCAFAVSQGWYPAGKMIHSGIYQVRLTSGDARVPINVYPTGTVLIQGNQSEMRRIIEEWWQQPEHAPSGLWKQAPPSVEPEPAPVPRAASVLKQAVIAHIGTDEVGKGDYFGPLVVAGIYVDEHTASQLLAAGVKDSRLLSDTLILSLAQEIRSICRGQGHVLNYLPERYNQLCKQTPHLAYLLARAHAQAIATLQKRMASTCAIVDQFCDASLLPGILQKMGCQIALEQRIHAQNDIAVVAASIVAHAECLKHRTELSKLVGIPLPQGASSPEIVSVGRAIVARGGRETLGKVAKLHFKTTQAIL